MIVGESWWTGKPISEFRIVAKHSRGRRVEQGLSKEVRCWILDPRRGRKSGYDFVKDARSGQPSGGVRIGVRALLVAHERGHLGAELAAVELERLVAASVEE
jgi:hypothetical protein